MSYGLTAPAAITNLVAMLAAAPELKGTAIDGGDVLVNDGSQLADRDAREAIAVGWTETEDDVAANGDVGAEGYSDPDRERYTIHCAVITLNGDGDIAAARNRVFAILAAAGRVIAGDRTLRGAVMSASLSSWELRPDWLQRESTLLGLQTRLSFDVACDAFTTR